MCLRITLITKKKETRLLYNLDNVNLKEIPNVYQKETKSHFYKMSNLPLTLYKAQ